MQKIHIVFLTIIALALCVPFLCISTAKNAISTKENRALAKMPQFLIDDKINTKFFTDFDDYIKDRFGGRNTLIKLAHKIDYQVLHKNRVNQSAVEGKNGFFYYLKDNLIKDFLGQGLVTDEQLEISKQKITSYVNWCNKQGIPYLFVIGPNKQSVYPEYHVLKRKDDAPLTRIDQITAIFDELGVDYVFSRDELLRLKASAPAPLYHNTDTHWNELGAYYCFKQIEQKVQKLLPNYNYPNIEYDITVTKEDASGDLLGMLGIDKVPSIIPRLTPKTGSFDNYFTYLKDEARDGVITEGKDKTLPRVVIFRDSFFIALQPFVSCMFSYATFEWRAFNAEKDGDFVLEQKPDIIIFESVERGAFW